VRSKSWLERMVASAMAGGLVFASLLGSLHDPGCAHHPGGGDHESWYGAIILHAEGSVELAPAGHDHGDHSSGESPDDCTCSGGLCVPSATSGPPVQTASEITLGDDGPAVAYAVVVAEPTITAERYLQPPGTGPPTLV
jgi:hypothetical protein